MKGIKKSEYDRIKALHSRAEKAAELHNAHLRELEKAVNETIARYMALHGEEVEANIEAINEIQEGLSNAAQEQVTIIDGYIQNRSSSWHDSTAAENMHDWCDSWIDYSKNICDHIDGYPFLSIQFDSIDIEDLPSKDR